MNTRRRTTEAGFPGTVAVGYVWSAHRSRSRGAIAAVVLLLGLIGGLALASFAGARRTASTFAAYEREVRLSHVAVNTVIPDLDRVEAIAALPGVESTATYLGLNGFPVIDDVVVEDFRFTGLFGSLDGRFFGQDRATLVAGRLPEVDATDEIALTPSQAHFARARLGDVVTYLYRDGGGSEIARQNYRMVGIVRLPPVIVDENDIIDGAILPPAATKVRLDAFYYAWQGVRLVDGVDGIGSFMDALRTDPAVSRLPPVVQRYDEVRARVQRSVRPQAVAIALFGGAAALAAVALAAQGASRLVGRWSGDAATLRALGLARGQIVAVSVADATLAMLAGMALAVAVAVGLSPFAPVGAVRAIAPDTAVHADWVALLGGGAILAATLIGVTLLLGWRLVQAVDRFTPRRPSALVAAAARVGLPLPLVLGASFAGRPPGAREMVPARGTLAGTALALIAVVTAVVFGASLSSLGSHPDRFGWNWDRMLIAQAGYGKLPPGVVTELVESERDITGWSMLALDELTVDGVAVPVLGLDRRKGGVEPPTIAGRPVTGTGDIALGVTTLRRIGKRVGDSVRVSWGDRPAELEIVGSVTFPAIGVGGGDHPSLGRGGMLTFEGLSNLVAPGIDCLVAEDGLCPRALVFDVAPGADADAVAARIAAADPDGTPGGTYGQPVTRPADVRNFGQMASLPLALAFLLAAAAVVALVATVLASVRARRRELAILRVLGVVGSQLRASVTAQAVGVISVGTAIGLPLGVVAGRASWVLFANDVGVVPVTRIPLLTLLGVAAGVIVACGLAALLPAALAARVTTTQALRAE